MVGGLQLRHGMATREHDGREMFRGKGWLVEVQLGSFMAGLAGLTTTVAPWATAGSMRAVVVGGERRNESEKKEE